jgi:hypothetical protein
MGLTEKDSPEFGLKMKPEALIAMLFFIFIAYLFYKALPEVLVLTIIIFE